MHLNFIIKHDGELELAKIFTDVRLQPVALTAGGQILVDDEFYILPSGEEELLTRRPDVIEESHFSADRLRELQSLTKTGFWPA